MSSPAPVRTVLVTGAAKRLGRQIALTLASAGWQVAVHYRDSLQDATQTVADCEQLGVASALFRANLANEAAVRELLPAVVRHFGRVDAVVNSASTFEHDTVHSFGFDAMEKHLRSNAGAAILLAQALHAHLQTRQGPDGEPARGAVVNLLDQKLWNPNPDFFSYTLSKAALEAANTLMAMALAPGLHAAMLAYGLFGVTSAVFLALHSAQTLRILPRTDRRGRDLGLFNLANTVPSLVMPWLAMVLVPLSGFPGLFVLLAVLAAAAALLLAPAAMDDRG